MNKTVTLKKILFTILFLLGFVLLDVLLILLYRKQICNNYPKLCSYESLAVGCLEIVILLSLIIKLFNKTNNLINRHNNYFLVILFFLSYIISTYSTLLILNDSEIINHKYNTNTNIFIFTVIIAPILEELFFRGLLLQYLINRNEDKISKRNFSYIIYLSLIFALFHLETDYKLFINHFIGSIIFSICYIWTKKLIIPIVFHSFWNLTVGMNLLTLLNKQNVNSFIIFVILILSLISFIFLFKRTNYFYHLKGDEGSQ